MSTISFYITCLTIMAFLALGAKLFGLAPKMSADLPLALFMVLWILHSIGAGVKEILKKLEDYSL